MFFLFKILLFNKGFGSKKLKLFIFLYHNFDKVIKKKNFILKKFLKSKKKILNLLKKKLILKIFYFC